MQIFVTGATGVLGSRVVPGLVAAGHAVTAVARSSADTVRTAGDVHVGWPQVIAAIDGAEPGSTGTSGPAAADHEGDTT